MQRGQNGPRLVFELARHDGSDAGAHRTHSRDSNALPPQGRPQLAPGSVERLRGADSGSCSAQSSTCSQQPAGIRLSAAIAGGSSSSSSAASGTPPFLCSRGSSKTASSCFTAAMQQPGVRSDALQARHRRRISAVATGGYAWPPAGAPLASITCRVLRITGIKARWTSYLRRSIRIQMPLRSHWSACHQDRFPRQCLCSFRLCVPSWRSYHQQCCYEICLRKLAPEMHRSQTPQVCRLQRVAHPGCSRGSRRAWCCGAPRRAWRCFRAARCSSWRAQSPAPSARTLTAPLDRVKILLQVWAPSCSALITDGKTPVPVWLGCMLLSACVEQRSFVGTRLLLGGRQVVV